MITLGNLRTIAKVRVDEFELNQGGSNGTSLAAFHKGPIPLSMVKRIDFIVGFTNTNTPIVRFDVAHNLLPSLEVAPINHANWKDFQGNVHFTDEGEGEYGMLVGL